ncbi:MAG: WD40/YVTN/BNR-like repeat-containing protein, partial [Ignavibacteria bacterium]
MSSHAQTWRVLHPFLSHTVVLNPNDPRKLYIGNWANQLLRSNDMGKTWYTVEMGDLGVPNSITSVGVSRADTSVILAGGYFFDGIRRSSNRGQTFDRVLNDSNNAKMWYISEAIVEDPSSPGTWYAARGSQNNGIWKSTDNGATWDSISAIPSAFTSRLCTITIRPDSTNVLYVGAKGGVMLRSTDRGVTWNRVPVVGGRLNIIADDSEIPKIVFSPREPLTGYAVVAITLETKISGNGGVLKTTDGGLTWDRIGFADTSFWAVDVRER